MHTKGHGIAATFCSRNKSHKVQQVELVATWSWDKISTELMLHDYNTISGHDGTCRCNINQEYIPATFPCVCIHCDFIPGTCLRYNTLLHVSLVCIAYDFVVGTCRCNMSLKNNPSCFLAWFCLWHMPLLQYPATCSPCVYCIWSCRWHLSLQHVPVN
jgi:hypothetical protein